MRFRLRLRSESLTPTPGDALVLGGGPAGAAAAIVLAQAGRAVTLIRPDTPPGGSLAQSIPPSARALLAEFGALTVMETGGFVPNLGNTVRWAESPVRAERFNAEDPGFHVDRAGFEHALDVVVRAAGVTVLQGFSARSATRNGALWHIECVSRSGEHTTRSAPWVVDATGRHGFLARRLGRVHDRRTDTVALVGRWVGDDPEPAWHGHTVVESHRDGWAWSVPVAPGVRCVTAMVDPDLTPLAGRAVEELLDVELAKTRLLRDGLRTLRRVDGSAWACPASLYTTTRYAEPGLLLAGDAGSFIDPLSSYGVKKSLLSGRVAGIAAATALDDPDATGPAVTFHDAHERQVAAEYRAHSVDFFRAGAEVYGHPFWTTRATAARDASDDAGGPDGRVGGLDCDVAEADARRALERLRSAPSLRLRAGATLRRVSRPALSGRRIALEPHLQSDLHPRPVRFHRSVDLRRLVEIAPHHHAVPELWAAYNRSGSAADLPDFVTALAVVCAAGFLELGDA